MVWKIRIRRWSGACGGAKYMRQQPWETTLIHRDYRTGNYLVDGGRLTAALDWEFAGWGDPREDIGWFTARCWRFGALREGSGRYRGAGALHARL